MAENPTTGHYALLLKPADLLDHRGDLLHTTLRLSGRRGPAELPITLSADAAQGQAVPLDGFVLASVAAFAEHFDAIIDHVAAEAGREAAAYAEAFGVDGFDSAVAQPRREATSGVEVGDVGAVVTRVHFERKRVPDDAGVRRMREVLYPELSEAEVRTLHDRPETRSRFDLQATVPWDGEHIRLFRYRDGHCVERSSA